MEVFISLFLVFFYINLIKVKGLSDITPILRDVYLFRFPFQCYVTILSVSTQICRFSLFYKINFELFWWEFFNSQFSQDLKKKFLDRLQKEGHECAAEVGASEGEKNYFTIQTDSRRANRRRWTIIINNNDIKGIDLFITSLSKFLNSFQMMWTSWRLINFLPDMKVNAWFSAYTNDSRWWVSYWEIGSSTFISEICSTTERSISIQHKIEEYFRP